MFKTHTKPIKEREELIENAVSASTEKAPFYEHKNTKIDLDVVRLDIGLPVYRMENYRTRIAQLRYVQDGKKEEDFFSSGQENESAQQAQHEILLQFSKRGKAESVAPIYSELQSEKQREPLLCSSSGVIINGNRRLSAMRDIYSADPAAYKHFAYVDCAILPADITQDEIREVEVRLQMRPETKLAYDWVNESLAIQELLESKRSAAYISDLMNKPKKAIERADRALREANIYLKEWHRAPGHYQHVENAEQFFKDMAKAIEGKEGEELEISRRIAWALISADDLSRRVYDYNFSFGTRSGEVVSSLLDRLDLHVSEDQEEADDFEDFDVDFGDDDESSLQVLIDQFDDQETRLDVSEELVLVCDSIIERDKEKEIGKAALKAIKAANAKLQEVDMSKAEAGTLNAISSQLESITKRVERLRTAVSKATAPEQ